MTTFLVTGANSGLGLELTRSLAARSHRVVMAVRDLERGETARRELLRQHPDADLVLERVDLTDQASVRALGGKDLGVEVLVNNAGMGTMPKQLTADGVLAQFAAYHLGHFLLSALLMPQITRAPDGRIVTVTSGFGKKAKLDLGNLDGSKGYSQGRAYMQSKVANSLFGAELDRRLRAGGSKVKSVLSHPGIAATGMQQKPKGLMGVLARAVSRFLARPAENGALPLLAAATSADVESGDIWGPGKGMTDPAVNEPRWPSFDDLEGARGLWEKSEQLTGIKFLSAP